MRTIRRGDRGPAVAEIRAVLRTLDVLPAGTADSGLRAEFEEQTELAVRTFQQSRGLSADGRVGEETWRALEAARWRLGSRPPFPSGPQPPVRADRRAPSGRAAGVGGDRGAAGARSRRASP